MKTVTAAVWGPHGMFAVNPRGIRTGGRFVIWREMSRNGWRTIFIVTVLLRQRMAARGQSRPLTNTQKKFPEAGRSVQILLKFIYAAMGNRIPPNLVSDSGVRQIWSNQSSPPVLQKITVRENLPEHLWCAYSLNTKVKVHFPGCDWGRCNGKKLHIIAIRWDKTTIAACAIDQPGKS